MSGVGAINDNTEYRFCRRAIFPEDCIWVLVFAFLSFILFCVNLHYLTQKIHEQDWAVSELFRWAWLKLRNITQYGITGIHLSVSVTKRAFGMTTVHLKVKQKHEVLFKEITIQRTDTLEELHKLILRVCVDSTKQSQLQVKQLIKNSQVLIERDDDISRLQSTDTLEVEFEERQLTKLEEILTNK